MAWLNIYEYFQGWDQIFKNISMAQLNIYEYFHGWDQIFKNISMAQLNIYEYFQGWDHGSTVDGDCCGFPLLPLHQDHRQLLRGCASEDNDSW